MQPKEITELKDAIRETHGCESLHVESVPVKEVFENQIAWEGTVEVFDLVGHEKAKRAYAWSYRDGEQNKTIAVLGIPPVDSPRGAPSKWPLPARRKWYDHSIRFRLAVHALFFSLASPSIDAIKRKRLYRSGSLQQKISRP